MKLSNKEQSNDIEEPKLDASFVNVYKGAHGVIFIFDMTNRNSYSYVEEQLSKVNFLLLFLILFMHRVMFDMTNISSYSHFEEKLLDLKKISCL